MEEQFRENSFNKEGSEGAEKKGGGTCALNVILVFPVLESSSRPVTFNFGIDDAVESNSCVWDYVERVAEGFSRAHRFRQLFLWCFGEVVDRKTRFADLAENVWQGILELQCSADKFGRDVCSNFDVPPRLKNQQKATEPIRSGERDRVPTPDPRETVKPGASLNQGGSSRRVEPVFHGSGCAGHQTGPGCFSKTHHARTQGFWQTGPSPGPAARGAPQIHSCFFGGGPHNHGHANRPRFG